jgi:erythromycin esterase-like protein
VASAACLCAFTIAAAAAPSPDNDSELDRVVKQVCQKQVVFLGEDAGHGGGKTLEVKVVLARRLLNECGFNAVLFESPVYDFLDLERSITLRTATQAQLSDAIGGLWSTTAEVAPWVSSLFETQLKGEATVLGLDPQASGATQAFARRRLAPQLASELDEPRRSLCHAEIERLTNGAFDDATPYDSTTRRRLIDCIDEIILAAQAKTKHGVENANVVMAKNLARYMAMSAPNGLRVREHAMGDNFDRARSRLGPGAKIIVWCATVHALKEPRLHDQPERLGSHVHRLLGDDAVAIGFSAFSGSHGRQDQSPQRLEDAPADALEARALADTSDDIRYLDREQLDALGTISARPITYAAWQRAAWGRLLDGIVVVRSERPPRYVRPAVSQQGVAEDSPRPAP